MFYGVVFTHDVQKIDFFFFIRVKKKQMWQYFLFKTNPYIFIFMVTIKMKIFFIQDSKIKKRFDIMNIHKIKINRQKLILIMLPIL